MPASIEELSIDLVDALGGLDTHDAAMTAARLRRGGAASFADAPTVYYALLRVLEAHRHDGPDPAVAGQPDVIVEREDDDRRGRGLVASVRAAVSPRRVLVESPHYLKASP